MADRDPHRLLRASIGDTAHRDPDRVALVDRSGSCSYGELALLLGEGGGDEEPPRREALTVSAGVAGVEAILRGSFRGDSLLLLDPKTTAEEAGRAEEIFAGAETGPGNVHHPCIGLSTSGSSGLAKVVELDWEGLQLNAAAFADAAAYGEDDVVWCTTPLAHLYCFGAGVLAGLLRGATVLLTDGMMDSREFADTALAERATVLLSVPFLFRRYLAALEAAPSLAETWSLRCCIAAGEPVPAELIEAWRELGGVDLRSHYGLTEGGHITLASGRPEDGVGAQLDDVELRIGEDETVQVRRRAPEPPYRIIGQAPDPTGWCDTGDLGHLDERGNLHITGRADQRINFAGKNVDPDEVEQAILACEGVADCAVAGVEGPDGVRVAAFVCVDPAAGPSDAEIRTQLARRLSPYKLPRHFVRVKGIPRTLTGKVRRGELIVGLDLGAEVGGVEGLTPSASGVDSMLALLLKGRPEDERGQIVLEIVRGQAAATVLGHPSVDAIDPHVSFKDLGFDSLAAVEMHKQLGRETGLRLPSTVVFDHPTPAAPAEFLRDLAEGRRSPATRSRATARSEEPIAIVGMSCRYPGWGGLSRGALAAARRGGGPGSPAFPERPRLGPRAPLRPRPRSPGRELCPRGRLPLRRGRVRCRVLRASARVRRSRWTPSSA